MPRSWVSAGVSSWSRPANQITRSRGDHRRHRLLAGLGRLSRPRLAQLDSAWVYRPSRHAAIAARLSCSACRRFSVRSIPPTIWCTRANSNPQPTPAAAGGPRPPPAWSPPGQQLRRARRGPGRRSGSPRPAPAPPPRTAPHRSGSGAPTAPPSTRRSPTRAEGSAPPPRPSPPQQPPSLRPPTRCAARISVVLPVPGGPSTAPSIRSQPFDHSRLLAGQGEPLPRLDRLQRSPNARWVHLPDEPRQELVSSRGSLRAQTRS